MKEKIESLASGELFIVPESDYGRVEVWRMHDVYVLFELPMYGGDPNYIATYMHDSVDLMIEYIGQLT